MGYYNDLILGDTDDSGAADEGWSIEDRRPVRVCSWCQTSDHPASAMQPSWCTECVHATLQGRGDERKAPTPTPPTLPTTDLTIPPLADILALIKERYDAARLHDDYPGAGQLDRARLNLDRGAGLSWSYGDLLIQSVNNRSAVYSVNRSGCTCPNGAAGRSNCWHVALYDLLIEMQETAADTADMEAERADEEDEPPPTPITIAQTPSGLCLSRGGESYTAVGPATLGCLIRQLARPASSPTELGQRLAAARRRHLVAA